MKYRVFYSFLFLVLASLGTTFAQGHLGMIREKLFNPSDPSVLVASHRGDWRNACENSLEAIENAINMGVDIVEIDLARTKDGQLILMHDDKVDRTTTGKGWVKDLTLEEIKELRLQGKNIFVPVVRGEEFVISAYAPGDPVKKGSFGIREPI